MSGRPALIAVLLLAGCLRSAEPQRYVLTPRPADSHYAVSKVIEVRRPSIAGYLDRPEIVRGVEAEQLRLEDNAVWAEPLDGMLARVLARDLAERLPNSRVVSELDNLDAQADTKVEVAFERLGQARSDEVVLEALVALRTEGKTTALERVALRSDPSGRRTGAIIRSMTTLLAELSDRIAALVAQRDTPQQPE